MKLGIIGAEKQEVSLLFNALLDSSHKKNAALVRVTHTASLEFHEGEVDGCTIVVVCCGIGKVNAALCSQILVSEFFVTAIINTGSAGGLAPNLCVCDMVVSTDLVQHDFDTTAFGYEKGQIPGRSSPFFTADTHLRALALQAFEETGKKDGHAMIEGRVASGDAFITGVEKRDEIVRLFAPACVEMEGAAIAQVCVANNVPFLIIRSISDLAGKEAELSYDEFSQQASQTSARVVLKIVELLAKKELQAKQELLAKKELQAKEEV